MIDAENDRRMAEIDARQLEILDDQAERDDLERELWRRNREALDERRRRRRRPR